MYTCNVSLVICGFTHYRNKGEKKISQNKNSNYITNRKMLKVPQFIAY